MATKKNNKLKIILKITLFNEKVSRLFNEKPVFLNPRLFTVLYFSVRSSRSNDLRYGLPSCMSVKTTWGAGGG